MQDLVKKVSYLKGLMAGLDIQEESKEGRIFKAIVEVLDDMAEAIADIHANQVELENYVDSIDEDLFDLEDEVYEGDHEEEEGDYVEVECPECHETVCFEADILDEDATVEVTCPNCDTVVFVNDDEYEPEEEEIEGEIASRGETEDI